MELGEKLTDSAINTLGLFDERMAGESDEPR